MAKRAHGVGRFVKTRSKKNAKRLAAKKLMLEEKAKKRAKNTNKKKK